VLAGYGRWRNRETRDDNSGSSVSGTAPPPPPGNLHRYQNKRLANWAIRNGLKTKRMFFGTRTRRQSGLETTPEITAIKKAADRLPHTNARSTLRMRLYHICRCCQAKCRGHYGHLPGYAHDGRSRMDMGCHFSGNRVNRALVSSPILDLGSLHNRKHRTI
jgi:hypothetical protein